MIHDWKKEIAVAWMVKQALMEADKNKIWSYHLPRVAAADLHIHETETSLGFQLDPRYREFLKHADGWQSFWHTADLFGTEDLIGGPEKENAEFVLSMLDESVLEKSGLNRNHLLPISATKFDKDLFVIARSEAPVPGMVVWFAGEEVERFSTFDDYFLAMVDYNRLTLQRLKGERAE